MTYPTFSLQGPSTNLLKAQIAITGSKSETNRLLLLQALFPVLSINNLSNSEDAQAMQRGVASTQGTVDIYHAGTAMRFLTAYYATQPGVSVTLTGSERMQERIKPFISFGACIKSSPIISAIIDAVDANGLIVIDIGLFVFKPPIKR